MKENKQPTQPEQQTSQSAPAANTSSDVKPAEPVKETPTPVQSSQQPLPPNQPQESPSAQPSQIPAPTGTTPPPPQKSKKGSYLSGKTTALILILAAVALFFLFLAITPQTPKQESAKVTAVIPTPKIETVLGLESVPTASSASATKTAQVNVTVDTNANAVNVVQLELSFDPTVISNVTVTPGTFIKDPVELTKDVDTKNGRISYALGIAPSAKSVTGKGILATLAIQFQPTATASSTTISFLPKTLVGAAGINVSVLKSTKNLQLTVLGSQVQALPKITPMVTPVQTASPSSNVTQ